MRLNAALAIGLLALGAAGAAPAMPRTNGRGGCNGLLAFASNRAQDVYPQIYRIGLDGQRTDVGGSLEGDWDPQPSPDGSKLAFWSARPGGGLLVSDADGSHPRRMQLAYAYTNPTVEWSPDSKRVAVTVDDTTSRIKVLDADSGAGTVIATGSDPQWSPDGSTIAFADYDGVSVVRPDGTGRRQLEPGRAPVWSPDGARLLSHDSVVSVAGGTAVSLSPLDGFAWTPDSSRILAYATSSAAPAPDLWSVAADGSDPRKIAENVRGATLSPDGQKLVFLRVTDRHVVITDFAGHQLRDLGVWDSRPDWLHMAFAPRWSPDGTKLVYWSGGKVIVADPDSGEVRTLAGAAGERADAPVWSDGSSVLVAVTDTGGNTDIYVTRPNGSDLRPVFADPVPEGGPSWSPDGKRLAFIRYGATPTLVVTDLAGHARVLLRRKTLAGQAFLGGGVEGPPLSADGSSWPGSPAWSPDGRKIAVAATTGILLVDVHTGVVRPFAGGVYPTWSRDGAIAYTDGMEGGTISVDSRARRKFSVPDFVDPNGDDGPGIATNLAWSPDGTKLAYTLSGVESGTGYVDLYLDSIRIIDRRTGRSRKIQAYSSGFAWSPDGRYFVQGGFNAAITRTDGRVVATLTHLRALAPSWQPLCRARVTRPRAP